MSSVERPLWSETQNALDAVRRWYRGPRARFISALVLSAVVLGLSWNWLAAAGVLSVILSALPCVAMCALGVCMSGMRGRSCGTSTRDTTESPLPPIGGPHDPAGSMPPEKEDIHA